MLAGSISVARRFQCCVLLGLLIDIAEACSQHAGKARSTASPTSLKAHDCKQARTSKIWPVFSWFLPQIVRIVAAQIVSLRRNRFRLRHGGWQRNSRQRLMTCFSQRKTLPACSGLGPATVPCSGLMHTSKHCNDVCGMVSNLYFLITFTGEPAAWPD